MSKTDKGILLASTLVENLRRQTIILPAMNTIERQVHQNRLLKIAREGGQMTPADLAKFEVQRRYATLVALAIEGMAMRHSDAMFYMPPDLPQDSLFHQFLNTSLPDEGARNLLQEYVGSTLLPDTRYATACFFIGERRNGKSVMVRLVKALHRQTDAMLLDKLEGIQLHGLVGASLALVNEAPRQGSTNKC